MSVVRVGRAATFPARFTLVAAMNPCPCGQDGAAGPDLQLSAGRPGALPAAGLGAAPGSDRPVGARRSRAAGGPARRDRCPRRPRSSRSGSPSARERQRPDRPGCDPERPAAGTRPARGLRHGRGRGGRGRSSSRSARGCRGAGRTGCSVSPAPSRTSRERPGRRPAHLDEAARFRAPVDRMALWRGRLMLGIGRRGPLGRADAAEVGGLETRVPASVRTRRRGPRRRSRGRWTPPNGTRGSSSPGSPGWDPSRSRAWWARSGARGAVLATARRPGAVASAVSRRPAPRTAAARRWPRRPPRRSWRRPAIPTRVPGSRPPVRACTVRHARGRGVPAPAAPDRPAAAGPVPAR